MPRTRHKEERQADFILISDPHLRLDTPVCRTDDVVEAQKKKWLFVRELAEKHGCPIICAGDVFHKWNASSKLNVLAMQMIPEGMLTIEGQHDLPGHDKARLKEAGLGVLVEAEHVELLDGSTYSSAVGIIHGFGWDGDLQQANDLRNMSHRRIAVVHRFVYKGKEPFPGAAEVGNTARKVMKQLKGYDLIVTGDNHQTFVERWHDQILVNPGSMIRSTAAQIDFRPSCFLYYADTNEVQQVFLPIRKSAVSREHIDAGADRDERIDSFITRLRHDIEVGLSFETNMKSFLKKNKVPAGVQNIIDEAMEGDQI